VSGGGGTLAAVASFSSPASSPSTDSDDDGAWLGSSLSVGLSPAGAGDDTLGFDLGGDDDDLNDDADDAEATTVALAIGLGSIGLGVSGRAADHARAPPAKASGDPDCGR
jgi:hypothetical protein